VPKRLPISTRLALWYGLSLTLLLGLVVAFLYTGFHLTLHRDFDADLDREARRVAEAVGGAADPAAAFRRAAEVSPYGVRLIAPSGSVVAANGRLPDVEVHAPDDGAAEPHTHGPDDVRTRYAPVPGGGTVAVAGVESGLHRETHRLGWLLALGVALGVAVAAASGYALARRALRPVAALTEAAGRIGPSERGARLPTGPGPRDELGDLAEAFNGMLARLDAAFERERRFRADAAHELLSPVTAAQSEVEVALRRERDPVAYREALGRVGRHVERMSGLVTGLLALSRAETDDAGGEPEAVDLGALAEAVARRVRPAAEAKGVALVVDAAPGTAAWAAPGDAEVILENLLDNAVKYTPSGGHVTVTVRGGEGEVVVAVADTGVGFDAAEGDRLFERFFRSDAPGVQAERGHGLGLAVAQQLAERNGGRVTAASAGPGTGSAFAVRLPVPSRRPSR
jgi:signal transduction histidine kinase